MRPRIASVERWQTEISSSSQDAFFRTPESWIFFWMAPNSIKSSLNASQRKKNVFFAGQPCDPRILDYLYLRGNARHYQCMLDEDFIRRVAPLMLKFSQTKCKTTIIVCLWCIDMYIDMAGFAPFFWGPHIRWHHMFFCLECVYI